MMESCMRQGLTLVAVFISAGLGLGIKSHDAGAGPLPAVSLAVVAPVLVIEAGWRRNWRRYGPDVVISGHASRNNTAERLLDRLEEPSG